MAVGKIPKALGARCGHFDSCTKSLLHQEVPYISTSVMLASGSSNIRRLLTHPPTCPPACQHHEPPASGGSCIKMRFCDQCNTLSKQNSLLSVQHSQTEILLSVRHPLKTGFCYQQNILPKRDSAINASFPQNETLLSTQHNTYT